MSTEIAADERQVTSSMEALHVDSSDCALRILDITGTLLDQPYVAQVFVMTNALFVWLGSDARKPSLSTLSTAVATRYSPMPLVTPVVGAPEMEEQQIAQRLARRTGKQCFVSCQLPDHLPELLAYAEKQLVRRLEQDGVIRRTRGAA
ncbi:hypothetical protein P43SY_007721 [Pythium insidiosum]|uniref:Uncharacterized protein n=1 Tax=Pythium insidiosum TaxID=114742 RepID=A0AAD5QCZ5_PYTIN|nr:hypothetical protein P43SY_007721 [Pythium insidiosum]